MSRDTQLAIGPNASLTAGQARLFFGMVAALTCGIALLVACLGLWLVLPFAGLELVALAAALVVAVRGNAYREVIRFTEGCVRIEFGIVGRGVLSSVTLSRSWTRAVLKPGANANAPTRLLLRSGAQCVEIATCLTDEEREKLQRRLQELLSPAWRESPVVPAVRPEQSLPFGE